MKTVIEKSIPVTNRPGPQLVSLHGVGRQTPKPPPLAAADDFFDRLAAADDKKIDLAG